MEAASLLKWVREASLGSAPESLNVSRRGPVRLALASDGSDRLLAHVPAGRTAAGATDHEVDPRDHAHIATRTQQSHTG